MLALLLACAADDSAAPLADPPTWTRDVAPIVGERCAGCHADGDIAPFPLTTYAEVSAMAAAVADSVSARRMPPWDADPTCNDYRYDPSLTDAQIAVISDWVDAGAPEGDPADAADTSPLDYALSRVDLSLTLPSPYTPTQAPDDYRCFAVDWPEEQGTYITGFDVVPDDLRTVHHVVAYLAPPEQVADYAALDDAEAGEGWTCFGGPGVGLQEDAQWLGGWAPGGGGGDFPNGTGIYMEPGSQVILQMHYNLGEAEPAPDQSTIDFMIADEVESPAYIQPWANPVWLYGGSMVIPASEEGVEHQFVYTFDEDADFRVHTAALHMHTQGVSAQLVVDRADGGEDCLLRIPEWDFHWQRTYVMEEALHIGGGDGIRLNCTWDNPTDEDLDWGEGTGDEMCLGTMLFSY